MSGRTRLLCAEGTEDDALALPAAPAPRRGLAGEGLQVVVKGRQVAGRRFGEERHRLIENVQGRKGGESKVPLVKSCLLYTSDAADE